VRSQRALLALFVLVGPYAILADREAYFHHYALSAAYALPGAVIAGLVLAVFFILRRRP
jgi:hypothetical protein